MTEFISLREIQRRTGISRPSLSKYVREHPHLLDRHRARVHGKYTTVWNTKSIPVFQMLRERGLRKRGKK